MAGGGGGGAFVFHKYILSTLLCPCFHEEFSLEQFSEI